jgi:hypothetical protein
VSSVLALHKKLKQALQASGRRTVWNCFPCSRKQPN